uniref:Caspase domain-containing protein n=1 Tax=Streptomyces spiroverticillatus TaxID=67366 RepID=C0SMV6_9ACTN|nr:hypothetical protein [Streptomyces spiroverticillatus]
MTRLSAPGTRVLLIGTGTHGAASGLPPVPAVMGTLADLGQVLVERCGLAEENLRVIRDPANPTELGIAIAQEAERAEDVLWVYYVGHGLVNPAGELYLATVATDSRPGWVAYTALAYTAVRGSLLQTAARSIVVVLDCCFSGRAVDVLGSAEEQEVDLARVLPSAPSREHPSWRNRPNGPRSTSATTGRAAICSRTTAARPPGSSRTS